MGKRVRLVGWVRRKRTLGNLTFIDLWDRYGITQLLFNPQVNPEACRQVEDVDREDVLQVEGVVRERENKNPDLPTGEIEIVVEWVRVLAKAETPPFTLETHTDGGEELRARYRYLDFRRPPLQRNLLFRHQLLQTTRRLLTEYGFVEIETPFLIRSTPEGARDFVVPSRLEPGKFYALPQSPQILKQLLMIGGFDRYFQIVRCFRDEDLRADRQPEFTQIDCEMSFVSEEDVMELFETFVHRLFREMLDVELPAFARYSWEEAMKKFGTDKPDLRNPLVLHHFPLEWFQPTELCILQRARSVVGILLEGKAFMTRKQWTRLEEVVQREPVGLPGFLAVAHRAFHWFYWGPIERFYSEDQVERWFKAVGGRTEDALLLFAQSPDQSDEEFMEKVGRARQAIAEHLGLLKDGFHPVWIYPFPLFSWNADENRWESNHHPFTAPFAEDVPLLEGEAGRVRARAYDLVINGVEIAGGSIRIHDPQLQRKIFQLLGYSPEQSEERFGFFLRALRYGTPPHGGIAFGFDRLCALMLGVSTIREVIAFPKNKSGRDPMMDAPAPIPDSHLRELKLQIQTE